MIKVQFESFLSDDQKEALRQINKNKKALAFYEAQLLNGWNEDAALQETYDELLFHEKDYKVTDLKK